MTPPPPPHRLVRTVHRNVARVPVKPASSVLLTFEDARGGEGEGVRTMLSLGKVIKLTSGGSTFEKRRWDQRKWNEIAEWVKMVVYKSTSYSYSSTVRPTSHMYPYVLLGR